MHLILRKPPQGFIEWGSLRVKASFLSRQTHEAQETSSATRSKNCLFGQPFGCHHVPCPWERHSSSFGREPLLMVQGGFPFSPESPLTPPQIGGFKLVTVSQKPENARWVSVMKLLRLWVVLV